jgi:carbon monoxide dehydrogenase subunit G
MACIHREIVLATPPGDLWSAVRDVGHPHERLFPGVLSATRMEADAPVPGVRVVTFANGQEVREPIVTIDDARRRVAWTATGGALAHHHASMEVRAEGTGSRLVWTTEVLPDAARPTVEGIVDGGVAALRKRFALRNGPPLE